jgi:hypothetical protein
MTLASMAILAGIGVLFAALFPRDILGGLPFAFVMTSVFAVPLGSALFIIRGYDLEPSDLLVRRLLWSNRIPLQDLRHAWADPAAMTGSIRLFGNGGLFSFSGLFYNRRLGRYRAFATNPRNSVVFKFPARTLIVTPEGPLQFLSALKLYCAQATISEGPPSATSA